MKLNLTLPQMMERWKAIRQLHSVPLSTSIERTDGTDTDELILQEIRKWYYNLLLNADVRLLAPVNIAPTVNINRVDGRIGIVELPDDVVRTISVRMTAWSAPARLVTDPTAPSVHRQRSPLTASGPDEPIAMIRDNCIYLFPCADTDSLASLMVIRMTDDTFEFDSLAFSTLLPYDSDFTF